MKYFFYTLLILSALMIFIKVLMYYEINPEQIGSNHIVFLNTELVGLLYSIIPILLIFYGSAMSIAKKGKGLYSFIISIMIFALYSVKILLTNSITFSLYKENIIQLLILLPLLTLLLTKKAFDYYGLYKQNKIINILFCLLFAIIYIVIGIKYIK